MLFDFQDIYHSVYMICIYIYTTLHKFWNMLRISFIHYDSIVIWNVISLKVPACFVTATSEAEVIMEHDAQSTSSFPYDDIDEAVEAQLLTSQGATSDASRDNYRREDALDQGDGKFWTNHIGGPALIIPMLTLTAVLLKWSISSNRWRDLRGGRPTGELWRYWSQPWNYTD